MLYDEVAMRLSSEDWNESPTIEPVQLLTTTRRAFEAVNEIQVLADFAT